MTTEVAIVQPYVPNYRVPFFEGLRADLGDRGITLRVVAGRPSGAQATRDDAATLDWLTLVEPRVLRVGNRHLSLTHSRRQWSDVDAVVVPHQGTSVDALSALAWRKGRRVGVWGHIAPYTSPLNPVDGAVERWQLRRADHVFAYMPSGRDFAIQAGVRPDRVTTVMNTIDSGALAAAIERVGPGEIARFKAAYDIPSGPLLAYVGGLDASKRIDLLAESLDQLDAMNSSAHVVVAGTGEHSSLLDPAVSRGQVTRLGYADTVAKATLLAASVGVVNPGRVGLLAVDCMVAQRPLLTTEWEWHAPELEYLDPGKTVLMSADCAAAFATAMDRLARSGGPDSDLRWATPPSMEDMVANFAAGVVSLVEVSDHT